MWLRGVFTLERYSLSAAIGDQTTFAMAGKPKRTRQYGATRSSRSHSQEQPEMLPRVTDTSTIQGSVVLETTAATPDGKSSNLPPFVYL